MSNGPHVKFNVAALVVILVAAAGMSYRLTMPWVDLNDYASAQISLIARNHYEHGFGVTRFLNVSRVDRNDPSQLTVYSHRPVLFPIVLSFVFAALEPDEWAARLFVITLAMAGGWVLYRLVTKTAGPAAGLMAAFFFTLAPVNLFFGRVVSLTQGVVFFIIAITWAYYRWLDSRSRRDFLLLVALMVLGMSTNWQAYYFSAILPVHYWMCFGRRSEGIKLAALALLGPLMFAIFLVHLLALFPGEATELWGIFRFRSGWMSAAEQVDFYSASVQYSVPEFFVELGKHFVALVLVPLLILALIGAATLGRRCLRNREDWAGLSMPAVLVAPAVCHTALFSNTMYIHDYLVLLYLPAIAAMAGIGISVLAGYKCWGRLTALIGLALCVTFLWQSVTKTSALHDIQNPDPLAIGAELAESTDIHDEVIVLGTVYHPAIEWYADRNVYFVDHDGPIEQIAARRRCVAVILKWTPRWLTEMSNPNDTRASMIVRRTSAALQFIEKHGRPVTETENITIYALEETTLPQQNDD